MKQSITAWDGQPLTPQEGVNKVYEFLNYFGASALLLAAHAALLELFTPELLALIRINFLPDRDKNDATLDANVLFGSLTYSLGSGHYKMDREVRKHLVSALNAWGLEYAGDDKKSRASRVARFARYFIYQQAQRGAAIEYDEDFVSRNYWVALAWDEPELAAQELARHVLKAVEETNPEAGGLLFTRIRPLLELPLAAYTEVLNYAKALEDLEHQRLEPALARVRGLNSNSITVGEVRLPAPSVVAERISRHADISARVPATALDPVRSENYSPGSASIVPTDKVKDKNTGTGGHKDTALHSAVKENDVGKVVQALSQLGNGDINRQGAEGKTALHLAAAANAVAIVERLLDAGADLHVRDANDAGVLMNAAANGCDEVAHALVAKGADLNQTDHRGNTSLHDAACNGHLTLTNFLIQEGADLNRPNKKSVPPLLVAARSGRYTIVETLLRHGARIDHRDEYGTGVLAHASAGGSVKIIHLLVEFGLLTSAPNKAGYTPAMFAAFFGQKPAFQYLIARGCRYDEATASGATPLLLAAQAGQLELVKLLVDFYPSTTTALNCKENGYWTAVRLAALRGYRLVVEYLQQCGATLHGVDEHGWNLLHLCCQHSICENSGVSNDYPDLLRYLIQAGLDINRKTKDGRSPLHIAVNYDAQDLVRTLLDYQYIQINALDNHGNTPLILAAKKGNAECIQALMTMDYLEFDATVENKQALPWAVEAKSLECVKALLSSPRVDRNDAPDGPGSSPIWRAAELKQWDIFCVLCADSLVVVTDRSTSGDTLLHKLAILCPADAIAVLVNRGFDVNAYNDSYETPLVHAIREKNIDTTQSLLAAGALTIRYPLKSPASPLKESISAKSLSILRMLVSSNADVYEQDEDGRTLLHHAVILNAGLSILKYLLSLSIQATSLDIHYRTPLHYISETQDFRVVDALVNQGADIDAQDHEGMTPLHQAIRNRNNELCSYLLNKGASAEVMTADGWTTLHLAALNNLDILGKLIEIAPQYLNVASKRPALTPLQVAAGMGALKACELLLEHGADLNKFTASTPPPLFIATEKGHEKVEAFLLRLNPAMAVTLKGENLTWQQIRAAREQRTMLISLHETTHRNLVKKLKALPKPTPRQADDRTVLQPDENGKPVYQLGVKLLRDASIFFETMGRQNEALRSRMEENKTVFQNIASLLEKDPTGELNSKPLADITARLLKDAAGFFVTVADKNEPIREQMLENAKVYNQLADLLFDDPLQKLR